MSNDLTGGLTGLKAAFDSEGLDGADFRYVPDAEQLDLLRDERGVLPNDALRTLRQRQGPGRRPGSQNKASKDIAKYFVGKYGHPLDALGQIMTTPTDVLVEQLKLAQGGEAKHKPVRAMDAMMLRIKAADIALPYIASKQPMAVDLTVHRDVLLNIHGLTDQAALAEIANAEVTAEDLEQLEYTEFAEVSDEGRSGEGEGSDVS